MSVFVYEDAYDDKFPVMSAIKYRYKKTQEVKVLVRNEEIGHADFC